jgi:acetone carboxylase beta subunit
VKRQVADPLGLGIEEAAAGVIELFETSLRNEAVGRILGKGYSPADYTLLCYGGGGPLHVAGYTKGVPYQQVLVPEWAAGFSAFGCACADFEYRYDKSVDLGVAQHAPDADKEAACKSLQEAWSELAVKVIEEFVLNGYKPEDVLLIPGYKMQYMGQLNDLEIVSPVTRAATAADWDQIVESFENTYGRVYASSARSPELGFSITGAILRGTVVTQKPVLPEDPDAGPTPPKAAYLGTRPFYRHKKWVDAALWKMEALKAGNHIVGPAIIESDATTFVVPDGFETTIDKHRLFHLKEVK